MRGYSERNMPPINLDDAPPPSPPQSPTVKGIRWSPQEPKRHSPMRPRSPLAGSNSSERSQLPDVVENADQNNMEGNDDQNRVASHDNEKQGDASAEDEESGSQSRRDFEHSRVTLAR